MADRERRAASAALRVGVAGAGWGTRVSVPAFRAAGWEVAGLWSRRPERAREEADRLGIDWCTDDADALLTRAGIDAVAIHTPPHTHLDLCLRAFAAGKHVLLDKPFTMNAAEAAQLREAAQASGLTAMVNFEFRFAPLRRQILDLLATGTIGVLRHALITTHVSNPLVALERPWRLEPEAGGGVLNELGTHAIDQVRQWFGEIVAVSADLGSFPPAGLDAASPSEDWFSAIFTLEGGARVGQTISWVTQPEQGTRITIVGSEGVIAVQSAGSVLFDGVVTLGRAGEAEFVVVPPPPDQAEFASGNGAVEASRRLIAALQRGIAEGRSPTPDFEDGWRSQRVVDAVRASAGEGRVVQLDA